nr:MAG TPA: hypothetical protein [Bacteriophage sp.]
MVLKFNLNIALKFLTFFNLTKTENKYIMVC